ncbi:head-to-tail stopper [Arthrobacter phage Suppi]|uniref:Head-to-tail stopper n=3 Tax=Korravirus wayne TaxID=1982085 RepID=A0A1D8ESS0_9CAUD|nr:head closure Hc1 [Arthrobacter phage Wayne]ALY10737.1 head-to-tail stopper [Arthrobacter phage Wayne]AOT24040.1 head-to-tail stopper [Arthrobacter phage Suppi]ASR83248.1 head-to-tail stopper [Arthrobacter phage Canowicakte]
MLPISFARQTLVRLRPTVVDDHGNKTFDYSDPTEFDLKGCIVQPLQASEVSVNRDATFTQYQVQAPASHDIRDSDHFRYAGKEYQINGEVQIQPSPTGTLDHATFTINRWEG